MTATPAEFVVYVEDLRRLADDFSKARNADPSLHVHALTYLLAMAIAGWFQGDSRLRMVDHIIGRLHKLKGVYRRGESVKPQYDA